MPSIPKISGLQKNFDTLTSTLKKLESRNADTNKEVSKLTKEIARVNKYNEEVKAEKIAEQKQEEEYPVVKYAENEMTFSELMLRKLDIL